MSADSSNSGSPPILKWSCCLVTGLGAIAFVVLAILGVGWRQQRQEERASKERWESQVTDVKAGNTTGITSPEPRFLEEFVRDQPEVAAKVTQVIFLTGKVSDERLAYLRQFPHLEEICFDEVWEGADSFLKRISGMESITSLSFYQTGLTDDGVRAVATLPNLKRLRIHYFWKGTSLKPLHGHKSIETISLEGLLPTKEWIEVLASLPKLREIELEEEEPISSVDLENLQKALPKVKIVRGK
jgi:hypothetical protein